ncbi:hemolymph lipopolysaccharide-binding protein-like [Chrysoperla carnea]|uniref:hemolymph lipopolysaccharide-binding protein-like n=1 Tax=Chrysoperla carnea TaxID=189513 RepID=UPI001D072074|nr:hemolymph lipopolysaccharide-binding protein-like [Chrysoperla carnea]XP_044727382.1 hemolymph lipopolysaccharide-binding protein-like [Chrysoperla carnea]
MFTLKTFVLFIICTYKFVSSLPAIQNKSSFNGLIPFSRNTVYPGYLLFETSLYKYHRDVQKWADARKICDAEGGHLVIINSEDEAYFVRGLMAKYPDSVLNDVKYKNQVLIGMHDLFKEGEFVTIDGKSLESSGYTYWEPGNPGNAPNQNCGSVTRTGGINDFPCDTPSTFICEIPLESVCEHSIINPNGSTLAEEKGN